MQCSIAQFKQTRNDLQTNPRGQPTADINRSHRVLSPKHRNRHKGPAQPVTDGCRQVWQRQACCKQPPAAQPGQLGLENRLQPRASPGPRECVSAGLRSQAELCQKLWGRPSGRPEAQEGKGMAGGTSEAVPEGGSGCVVCGWGVGLVGGVQNVQRVRPVWAREWISDSRRRAAKLNQQVMT